MSSDGEYITFDNCNVNRLCTYDEPQFEENDVSYNDGISRIGQEFDRNEFTLLVIDDNADGSDVSPRTQQCVDDIINKIRTYESNKHDGQEFEGNEFSNLVIDDNADGSNVSSRTQQRFNDKFPNDDNDSDYSRPGRLANSKFHPLIFMGSRRMQLFWLLLVMGSYKILQLFSTLLFASTMLKISQSMGSDKSFKALIFSLLIISSSVDIKDLQSMGSVKYHKSLCLPKEISLKPCMCKSTQRDFPLPTERATRTDFSLSRLLQKHQI